MADRRGQLESEFSGGSDVWDDGLVGAILLQDYFDTAQVLAPAALANNQTFFVATVSQTGGTANLSPSLYSNAQTFFGPSVSASRELVPSLLTASQTFFAPSLSSTYDLAPSLFANGQTFFTPNAKSAKTLSPAKADNVTEFFSPTLAAGLASLAPSLFTNTPEFFEPVVFVPGVSEILAPTINNTTFFLEHKVLQGMRPVRNTFTRGFLPTPSSGPRVERIDK